jgi:uncharacterized lipoprotein YmbA
MTPSIRAPAIATPVCSIRAPAIAALVCSIRAAATATPVCSLRAAALAALVFLGLTGCASAPTHFLTLVPMQSESSAAVSAVPDLQVESVAVPADIDQPDLVVRESDGSVALLDTERWIAPLSDQIRLSLNLALERRAATHAAEVPAAAAAQPVRIRVEVLRFDAVPARYALLESIATLNVAAPAGGKLACETSLRVPVAAGFTALAEGFQAAIDGLAGDLMRQAASLRAGTASCN